MSTLNNVSALAGRFLLSSLFLASGLGKIAAYAGTAAYMSSMGVPGALLPIVIAVEVLCAVALIVGWQVRVSAVLLTGYTLLTALIFHNDFGNQMETVMFLKNISIAGGLLLLAAHGPGSMSLQKSAHPQPNVASGAA